MKLYDNPMANSPRKVRMFLVEKNITDVEIVNIDLMQGGEQTIKIFEQADKEK